MKRLGKYKRKPMAKVKEVNKVMIEAIKTRRRLKKLLSNYSESMQRIKEISRDIKVGTALKTKFNQKLLKLFNLSRNNSKEEKESYTEMLKSMGKNVLQELFGLDKVKVMGKADFRRFVESKVHSYLDKNFIDFEKMTEMHVFELMKLSMLKDLEVKNSHEYQEKKKSIDLNLEIFVNSQFNSNYFQTEENKKELKKTKKVNKEEKTIKKIQKNVPKKSSRATKVIDLYSNTYSNNSFKNNSNISNELDNPSISQQNLQNINENYECENEFPESEFLNQYPPNYVSESNNNSNLPLSGITEIQSNNPNDKDQSSYQEEKKDSHLSQDKEKEMIKDLIKNYVKF